MGAGEDGSRSAFVHLDLGLQANALGVTCRKIKHSNRIYWFEAATNRKPSLGATVIVRVPTLLVTPSLADG